MHIGGHVTPPYAHRLDTLVPFHDTIDAMTADWTGYFISHPSDANVADEVRG